MKASSKKGKASGFVVGAARFHRRLLTGV